MSVQKFIDAVKAGSAVDEASRALASSIADTADVAGIGALIAEQSLTKLIEAAQDKKVGAAAFVAFADVVKAGGSSLEPLVVPLFPQILAGCADKDRKVVLAAEGAARAVASSCHDWAVPTLAPALVACMSTKSKPSEKEVAVKLVALLAEKAPAAVGRCLITLIPAVSALMWDIKKEVKAAAIEAMTLITRCSGNKDLEPFAPVVLQAIQEPTKVAESVEALAGCIFVQNVEAPALAVTTPVLVRGLNERSEAVRRKCCVIIDNMCKLVDEPKEVLPLMPKLQPLLAKQLECIADPEARSVAERAYKTLTKAGGEGKYEELTAEKALEMLQKAVEKNVPTVPQDAGFGCALAYVAALAANLTNGSAFDRDVWASAMAAPLARFVPAAEAEAVTAAVLEQCEVAGADEEEEDEAEGGVDMYKGVFSLAYGSLTLLNNTKLNLKRNRFYGLLGPNNCGKTTLMRAVANEQVEGFPKRDELKTIFVEHEIQEREVGEDDAGYPVLNIDLTGSDWVVDTCNHVYKMEPQVTKEQVDAVMEEIGFGNSAKGTGKDRAADANMGVTTYSGGWKMKMQLCAATLMNADILMLDEPTGHLDVKNVLWLQDWLAAFMEKGGSVIATSHDTSFLNIMCTHIVDFQDRKLKMFRGERGSTLNGWVEKYPEKKGYFELKNDVVKFTFPKPGALEGVKSKTKAIMKMAGVAFQYPSRDTPTVMDIGLQVSQVSRVAVIGPNGAGKSTAIKLLTGELKPSEGTIWKHPSMRMAYVAQHAFHHLEKHMTKTPAQYIMWRFAGNDDQESLEFKEDGITVEDEAAQAVQWYLDPKQSFRVRKCETKEEEKHAVKPETLLKRRENKKEKTKEYEVKWMFKSIESTNWVDRDTLIRMGYLKMVQRKDEQEAAAAGLMTKPLTQVAVEKHLGDFGIEPEQASHTMIQALSGGQKVKVVLAASMWQNPHLLILDEPTNYLDRDGLGALTKALDDYEGGVIIISHNREFANAVSQEKWIMDAGRLRREGESLGKDEEEQHGNATPEELRDSFGNVIKVNVQKTLSDKEKKAELKRVEKQLKDHSKKKYLSEDEYWELMDRKDALKAELAKQ